MAKSAPISCETTQNPRGGVRGRSRGSRKRQRGRNSRHRNEHTSVPCSNGSLKAHRDELGPIGKACEPTKVPESGYCEYIRRRKSNARIGRESLEGLVGDAFSRKVIGRLLSGRITEKLAIDAIERAVGRDPPPSDWSLALHDDSKNVASRFCGNRNGATSCSRDRIAAS